MEVVDALGNIFGRPILEITGPDGKPKTIGGGGGSPTGPAGGDLSGSYPNPGVNWVNGLPVYNLSYYPLSSNPAGYLTTITSLDITTALGYTPYSNTNPAGYITGITGLDVTTALGYTPVNKAGDTMLGFLTLNADPTSSLHAATKQYVDNLSGGINFHAPCHVATTGNLSATYLNGVSGVGATLTSTINAALVIDTHTLSVGDRVLVWQQTAGLQNGIYSVTDAGSVSTPWILTRATDADNSPTGELQNGDFTFIQIGATYGGYGFILNTTGVITVGVTAINYVQFNAAQVVAAGYGLQELTPNVLSVDSSVIATVASLSAYLTTASAAATYYPLTNPSGYISGITSLDVTTALGYTPYNATNPAGYITGITSIDVTTALGYTPYDAANPAGYITSAALSPYLTTASAALTYYPIPTGTTAQYLRGDGSLATFPSIPSFTPSALTKTDDTNVTLTLGGTPSTALLQAVSLTLGWTGTLADGRIASATNWNTAYTNRITSLTTTGSSGAATLLANVLNIPNYTLAGLGGVPTSRTITINGTTQDLSADRTWTVTAPDPAGWTTIVKSANQTVTNNATLQDDTELQFSVVAAGNYMVELLISTSGDSSAADYKFGFAVSAGTMNGIGSAICQNAANAQANTRLAALVAATTNSIPVGQNGGAIPASSGVICASANFSFYASSNATFKFQFAQNTATAGSSVRTWKGSILRYKRLD